MPTEFEEVTAEAIRGLADRFLDLELEIRKTDFGDGLLFIFPKLDSSGFDVGLEVYSYGVYPIVEGWRGGALDVTVLSTDEILEAVDEFIVSVLSTESFLDVSYSNEKPYKFTLCFRFDGELITDSDSRVFYNWFGKRSVVRYQNNVQIDA